MADQPNPGARQIIPTALHAEMERSYLEYAMSVIVGRALPDARDGLKPVHRRILYAMHELGLTPDRPFRKCARVVGDVLGKYHPHGDQSVYDALVRLVQDFSSRYPLLAGHGNFGSVDNDPPAAMRYTETRLSPVAQQSLLAEIGDDTVDFVDNFDNSQQEPLVLPAQLPILLLNGCSGIAVGMATNVPPHNLTEIIDGLIALIDRPTLTDEQLWAIIPGPDFPTGGEIIDVTGVREAYQTGRGTIPVRGVAQIEQVQIDGGRRRRTREAIIVTELPFQVNKAGWIEKLADLVNQGRIEGIADIRDESDRDGMRVVIETKRDTDPRRLLRQLYRQTALQSNFGAIFLALVNNEPRQLGLRELLQTFLAFREQTLTRRYSHQLDQAQRRLHLVEGLRIALAAIDTVIEILRQAPDGTTARGRLQEQLAISETQADSILAMPLRRLTGLEQQKLQTEYDELRGQITELETLLGDRHELLKSLKKDLRALKRKFGDARRTRIVPADPDADAPELPEESSDPLAIPEDACLQVTASGYVRWQAAAARSKSRPPTKLEQVVVFNEAIGDRRQFIAATESGKVYPVAIGDVPEAGERRRRKTMLLDVLPASVQAKREAVVAQSFLPDNPGLNLLLLTERGKIKCLAGSDLAELSNRGLSVLKLKAADRLHALDWIRGDEEVAIATSSGRLLRFPASAEQLPIMGRTAQGNQAARLRASEQLAGYGLLHSRDDIVLLLSEQGYAKRLPAKTARLANRGDIGTQVFHFANQRDRLLAMQPIAVGQAIALVTSTERLLYLDLEAIPLANKDGAGDRLAVLTPEETISRVLQPAAF
ncbi:MAG: DNA topoisomerase 4 subunit A [Spirulinaceae cyanobacterium SM2_1_0]|nr:DNA topoisomerase 4 subunit A [Spirulinaceae cyanobacterium SM2_1_0]